MRYVVTTKSVDGQDVEVDASHETMQSAVFAAEVLERQYPGKTFEVTPKGYDAPFGWKTTGRAH